VHEKLDPRRIISWDLTYFGLFVTGPEGFRAFQVAGPYEPSDISLCRTGPFAH
jgi:hypothetical protein